MALATTSKFSEFVLLIGDGGSPTEVFTAPCVLSSRGVQRTANTESDAVFDCADDNAPGVIERQVISLEQSVSGSGQWAREAWTMWLTWYRSGLPRNCKLRHTNVQTGQVEYENFLGLLTKFNETGERGKKLTAEIEIMVTGAVTTVNKA